jgi:putative transposase
MSRAVLVGVAHHVTQRGVNRHKIFEEHRDQEVYLRLVRSEAQRFGADLLGYCLMPNHTHWVVIPQNADALARTFGEAHGRYAAYANAKLARSGHFWQNRFFSCALDRAHLWTAMRYVERNPVRAGLVDRAHEFRWSSAAAHLNLTSMPAWLATEPMRSTFTPAQWELYLKAESFGEAELEVRKSTYTGRPAGSPDFIGWAEASLGRKLSAHTGGRPRKSELATLIGQADLFNNG